MTRRSTYLLAVAVLVASTSVVGVAQQEPIEEIRAKAEQGDADAQYSLGVIYRQGQGVAPDDVEAARWFRLAADQGLAESGIYVSKNRAENERPTSSYLYKNQ